MSSLISRPLYDEKVNTRVAELRLCGTTLQTPIKAVEKLNPKGEINEFAPRFNQQNIQEILTGNFGFGTNGKKRTRNSLSKIRDNYVEGLINVMIPTYEDTELTPDEMSKMESLQYSNSDLMIVPRFEGILKANKPDRIDQLIDFTKTYVGGISPNNKVIVGNIPRILSFNDIGHMMDEYYKMGITSFVIDCCNYGFRTHLDVQRDIQKKLQADGFLDESLLYSINVKRSTLRKAEVIPAEDFLMFGFGIDIIGNMHISPGGGDPDIKKANTFVPDKYCYEKENGLTQNQADRIRAENYVAQNEEMKILKEKIREKNTSLSYLKTKEGAKVNLEDMLRNPSQRCLSGIF